MEFVCIGIRKKILIGIKTLKIGKNKKRTILNIQYLKMIMFKVRHFIGMTDISIFFLLMHLKIAMSSTSNSSASNSQTFIKQKIDIWDYKINFTTIMNFL